jgi:lipopolysaccharide heptosyltransferase II
MADNNIIAIAAANLAGVPFRLFGRRPFSPPRKALILQPCCISRVMLATPLLAALSETYPRAQFDWAISDWARPAVAGNPRITELINTGRVTLEDGTRAEIGVLVKRLKKQQYDTCFVPSSSSQLSYIAWRASIPQRIGLNAGGRGFAHTLSVRPPKDEKHKAKRSLAIARELGIEDEPSMEFHPSDSNRSSIIERLVAMNCWQGQAPLVILHPGGGNSPWRADERKRWPVERYALLGSRLVREQGACLFIVGSEDDRPLAKDIEGMIAASVTNLAGRITLGQLGALCEVADLYVGNDSGPTQIAAAVGCPTLTIFGPTDPAETEPYSTKDQTAVLQPETVEEPFSWDDVVPVNEAVTAAIELLNAPATSNQLPVTNN